MLAEEQPAVVAGGGTCASGTGRRSPGFAPVAKPTSPVGRGRSGRSWKRNARLEPGIAKIGTADARSYSARSIASALDTSKAPGASTLSVLTTPSSTTMA